MKHILIKLLFRRLNTLRSDRRRQPLLVCKTEHRIYRHFNRKPLTFSEHEHLTYIDSKGLNLFDPIEIE